jgi:hypothetical protein
MDDYINFILEFLSCYECQWEDQDSASSMYSYDYDYDYDNNYENTRYKELYGESNSY